MIDYPAAAAVAAVLGTGSFERAAAQLGVTPSAVSQRVKGLEERLGVPLIVRGSPCTPTVAGTRLRAHFDQVLLLEHDLLLDGLGLGWAAESSDPTLKVAINSDSLATWFPAAAARFSGGSSALLDLLLDDEAHTAERLRTGQVVAAVTTTGKPVQGCRTIPLGRLRYVATASPAFAEKYFPRGVKSTGLAAAPVLRFDARDALQDRWVIQAIGSKVEAPTHWVPSTRGFLDLTLAGLGWSLTPELLAGPLIASGHLVDLDRKVRVDVPLFWRHLRISGGVVAALTGAVREAAAAHLVPVRAVAL